MAGINSHFSLLWDDELLSTVIANQVVAAFLAWTPSTSGVEQLFSVLKRSPAEQASSRADTDRRLAIVAGSDKSNDKEIIAEARLLYSRLLPSGRAQTASGPRKKRFDAGRTGGQNKAAKSSEKQWLRDRRASVDKAVGDTTTPPRRPPQGLPESLAKEIEKQKKGETKRKVEALAEGWLLPHEVDDKLRMEAAKRRKADFANDQQRCRAFKNLNLEVNLKVQSQTRCWALTALPSPAYLVGAASKKQQWIAELRKHGVNIVTEAACH